MQEIDVILATRRSRKRRGPFTDAHPSLLSAADLRPFRHVRPCPLIGNYREMLDQNLLACGQVSVCELALTFG
jgi:hypothetical protein